jgi:hypothetical protein
MKKPEKPEMPITLRDYHAVRMGDPDPREPPEIKALRDFMEKKPADFQNNLIALERDYQRTIQAWLKSQSAGKTAKAPAQNPGAPVRTKQIDEGSQRCLELYEEMLAKLDTKLETEENSNSVGDQDDLPGKSKTSG